CLLLILLLRQSPLVADAVMVNGGEQVADPQMMLGEWDVPLLSMDEALERCDVLIEMSAQFGADWKIDAKNRLRGAVAYYDFQNIRGSLSSPCALYAGATS
ncbi:DUF2827 family protein, partial [Pseudomonas sp. SIMBA_064]